MLRAINHVCNCRKNNIIQCQSVRDKAFKSTAESHQCVLCAGWLEFAAGPSGRGRWMTVGRQWPHHTLTLCTGIQGLYLQATGDVSVLVPAQQCACQRCYTLCVNWLSYWPVCGFTSCYFIFSTLRSVLSNLHTFFQGNVAELNETRKEGAKIIYTFASNWHGKAHAYMGGWGGYGCRNHNS